MNYTFKTKEGKDLKIFYNDLFVDKDNYGIVTFFKTTGNKCKEIKKDVNQVKTVSPIFSLSKTGKTVSLSSD